MSIVATIFPQDNCTAISITSTNENKLFDFIATLPDYFDILVNDADGGQYPAQRNGILIDDIQETEEQTSKEQNTEAKG